jgi:glycerophosphoryl diester phosphodiesterase
MLVIAHRGASLYASGRAERGTSGRTPPENTLEAFDLAYAQGADGLEFDVHLAACGTPVVIHDATLERTTQGTGAVCEHTAEALARLGVPTLAELLRRYADKGTLLIEIKAPEAALPAAQSVEAAVRSGAWKREHLVLIGFEHACLRAVQAQYPRMALGFSRDASADSSFSMPASAWLPLRADRVDAAVLAAARRRGSRVIAWTVNEAEEALRLAALGTPALMTDHPEKMKEWLRS